MSGISELASIATSSAAASVGWSGGRSAYASMQKGFLGTLLIAALVAGSGVAGFFLRRGTNRGWIGSFFLLFLPCIILLGISALVGYSVATIWQMPAHREKAIVIIFSWQAATFILGFLIGGPFRRRRQQTRRVKAANESFLRNIGFQDVGGREGTWLDQDGRELVLHDARKDALVFRIKSQRNGRSLITLDPHGQMMSYIQG